MYRKQEIGYLLDMAVKINKIATLLGDEPVCTWFEKDGKRYLSMFDGKTVHIIPDSFDLSMIKKSK